MMKIVLNKGKSSGAGQGAKPSSLKRITAACPNHLVLANLPVACIGSVPATSRVKILGSSVHHQLGEKVHFCISCNLPIAIYGRLKGLRRSSRISLGKGSLFVVTKDALNPFSTKLVSGLTFRLVLMGATAAHDEDDM